MTPPKHVLIVASSGRMLAQAARCTGYIPFVIDLYADRDTRLYAQECTPIASLDLIHVVLALEAFFSRHSVTHVVYGSGFENHPESLHYLANHLTVWGNCADTFCKLQDKKSFFSILHALSISYPVTTFVEPKSHTDTWLIKPLQGHGGVGIRHYHATDGDQPSVYWQRFINGSVHSVLFLADGKNAQIIGFNNQWSTQLGPDDFIFSGIRNKADISEQHKRLVAAWLPHITHAFNLKGLNSLDFMCTPKDCYVLEINARPPASMQLYSPELFEQHIHACQGQLPLTQSTPQSDYTVYQIVYAERDTLIPPGFVWPSWCHDLPEDGVLINTGQPICSMIASQKQPQQLMQQLTVNRQMIINLLDKGVLHGI